MYNLSFTCISNTGLIQDHNEDNVLFFGQHYDLDHQSVEMMTNNCETLDNPCVGVFDGMGGEQCGELASYLAAQFFAKQNVHSYSSRKKILELYYQANEIVLIEAKTNKLNNIGTTASIVYFDEDYITISNVGDSPIYLIRNNKIKLINEIHNDENIYGVIEGRKPKLTQYLGLEADFQIEPYIKKVKITDKDRIIICTDGLSDLVHSEDINKITNKTNIEEATNNLLNKALENGGIDNVTVILCEVTTKRY